MNLCILSALRQSFMSDFIPLTVQRCSSLIHKDVLEVCCLQLLTRCRPLWELESSLYPSKKIYLHKVPNTHQYREVFLWEIEDDQMIYWEGTEFTVWKEKTLYTNKQRNHCKNYNRYTKFLKSISSSFSCWIGGHFSQHALVLSKVLSSQFLKFSFYTQLMQPCNWAAWALTSSSHA